MIAIIPARGESKGIPFKNIKLLNGKPLLVWSVERALSAKNISEVIVSTDDVKIAKIAQQSGAEVAFRPAALATDYSKTVDVLHHHWLELGKPSEIMTLQPTSPLRSRDLIDHCVDYYSSSQIGEKILATGFISKRYEFGSNNNIRRQELSGYFYDDGNIYIHSGEVIARKNWCHDNALKFFTAEFENYEIDTEIDFFIVEQLHRKYYK